MKILHTPSIRSSATYETTLTGCHEPRTVLFNGARPRMEGARSYHPLGIVLCLQLSMHVC